ncbi:hypothetical protein [Flavobacterium sp. FlaQc-50]|uniref:hypothetical protein n=1 Tax=unclassified Flavobacterium TaxID=196869 RepID=UPI003757B87D
MKRTKKSQSTKEVRNDSKIENQIGCGYCDKEKKCPKRDPTINKAKQGCEDWKHWQDSNQN